ncbi:efflux RND transporter periplasmic adaptor subunit [Phyllobacterium phragmitis]|uniref:HlyD family secretion protein n=1 Tax=Phyllobacterium phragmitis TaxID=2670329 RepID=A0ABQ0H3H2_9HYPH
MKSLKLGGRVAVTLIFVIAALAVGRQLWIHYMDDPWTRDGKVRADIVNIAPDVSGLVSEVLVRDNQTVRAGDVLFRVDRQRFRIALEQAEAALQGAKARLDQARRENDRQIRLGDAGSIQAKEQAHATLDESEASFRQATAEKDLARLNLDRSEVKATVNGTVTNLSLQPGDYVSAGTAKIALVDTDTLRVEGYFEETKLARIHVGDRAAVHLMGQSGVIEGHVESIATGIADRERTSETGLLANVNPAFTWVRLAQRVPVRIALDMVPETSRLIAGLTATVKIEDAGSKRGTEM